MKCYSLHWLNSAVNSTIILRGSIYSVVDYLSKKEIEIEAARNQQNQKMEKELIAIDLG